MERTYQILGVPRRTGSLYPGTENDPQAYRKHDIAGRLRDRGCRVKDLGDVPVPELLPSHSIAPVRNWPGPALVWEAVRQKVLPLLREPGEVPLLIGCDCSVVVGSASALKEVSPEVHVIYIDGDMDAAAPTAQTAQSAASLALWLLTQSSVFWKSPVVKPSQVTVMTWTRATPEERALGFRSLSLEEFRTLGPQEAARRVLSQVPPNASILIHFDVDAVSERDLGCAYFPHPDGMSLPHATDLLRDLVSDPRVRLLEISEYAALRDADGEGLRRLIQMLGEALSP